MTNRASRLSDASRQFANTEKLVSVAYSLFNRGVQILLDTFSVKDVLAPRLDRVLRNIVTETANGRLTNIVSQESACIVLAAKN